jgi:hypothetical protein
LSPQVATGPRESHFFGLRESVRTVSKRIVELFCESSGPFIHVQIILATTEQPSWASLGRLLCSLLFVTLTPRQFPTSRGGPRAPPSGIDESRASIKGHTWRGPLQPIASGRRELDAERGAGTHQTFNVERGAGNECRLIDRRDQASRGWRS